MARLGERCHSLDWKEPHGQDPRMTREDVIALWRLTDADGGGPFVRASELALSFS